MLLLPHCGETEDQLCPRQQHGYANCGDGIQDCRFIRDACSSDGDKFNFGSHCPTSSSSSTGPRTVNTGAATVPTARKYGPRSPQFLSDNRHIPQSAVTNETLLLSARPNSTRTLHPNSPVNSTDLSQPRGSLFRPPAHPSPSSYPSSSTTNRQLHQDGHRTLERRCAF